MTLFLVAFSTWLHTLATTVLVGYYFLLSLVYLPTYESQLKGAALGSLMEAISARMRPYFGGSVLVFIITGTYLMLIDQDYQGIGNFSNPWSVLIVVKHVVVLLMIALGIVAEHRYLPGLGGKDLEAMRQFRLAMTVTMILGLLALLLTAIAQAV